MSYRAGDVRPGKCFSTGGEGRSQVRRVCSVAGGAVVYEGRELRARKGAWGNRAEMPMQQFLDEAAREVGCDYAG